MPLQASMAYPSSLNTVSPGYASWDEASLIIHTASSKIMPLQDEFTNIRGAEGVHTSLCVMWMCFVIRRVALLKGTFQHFLWHITLLIQLILDQRV